MYEWIGKLTRDRERLALWAHRIEYLPPWLINWLLTAAGLLLYSWARQMRRDVMSTMKECLPNVRPKALRRSVRRYFIHLTVSIYEVLVKSNNLSEQDTGFISMEGEDYLREVLQEGRGAILYSPHLGNFFYTYWFLSQRYDCLTVATASSPELRPAYLHFQRLGCRGLDYDETPPLELMRKLRAHLAGGGVLFILGDFYRPAFPLCRMFDRPTRGPMGAAVLAIEDRIPVIPCYGYRVKGFHHQVILEKPIRLDLAYTRQERADALQLLQSMMEGQIRQVPEQWFYWFNAHERWETDQEKVQPQAHQQKRVAQSSSSVAMKENGTVPLR